MPELKSEFLFTITATVAEFYDMGPVPAGTRHVDLIGAGKFEGPRLRGDLLPGGMDMKTLRADGSMVPNVRLVLETVNAEPHPRADGRPSDVYGGIQGGLSNGEPIVLRVLFKPPATLTDHAKAGRHDPCILPRAVPVVRPGFEPSIAPAVTPSRIAS